MVRRRVCTSRHHKGRRWQLDIYFQVQGRWEDGRIRWMSSHCTTCQRLDKRERLYNGRKKESKLGLRTNGKRYVFRNEEERELYLAYRREYNRRWRKERGATPHPEWWIENRSSASRALRTVPMEPLRKYVFEDLTETTRRKLDVETYRYLHTRKWDGMATWDFIDDVLMQLGHEHMLLILYPVEDYG